MKKFLFSIAIAMFIFTGCSKDDEQKNNELVGTTWKYKEVSENREDIVILEFTTNSRVIATSISSYVDEDDETFEEQDVIALTYNYQHPNFRMDFVDENPEGRYFIGVVNGNTIVMTTYDIETDEAYTSTTTFTKQ